ncbi:hypothetical protein D3C84_600610 [compost metagenome]
MAFWCWPNDRLTVAACHQVQAFADRWGSGVGRDAFAPFDVIAKAAHQAFHRHEFTDRLQDLRHVRVIGGEAGAECGDE